MLRRYFPDLYEGWLIVGSMAFMILVLGGTFNWGFGTIFNPIRDEFGWSAAATSGAFFLRSEVAGIAAPFIGLLIDRFGPRLVFIGGTVLVALGMTLMSFMTNIWQFYGAMFVISAGISSAGGPVGMVAIATWFERRRARALSVMTVGGAFSGIAVIPVAFATEEFGWRAALRLCALAILMAGAFASTHVRSRPVGHPQPFDGIPRAPDDDRPLEHVNWGVPVRVAVRAWPFILLGLIQMSVFFGISALVVHQIPYMEDIGISTTTAGAVVAFFALFSLVGRLGIGYVADRYDKRIALGVCIGLTCIGMPLLAAANSLVTVILVMMIIAPGFGGMVPLRPAILADYFGTKSFGTINGISMFVVSFGTALSPVLVGRLFDVTGEYTWGWLLAGAVALAGIPALLALRAPYDLIERYGGRPLRPSAPAAAPAERAPAPGDSS